MTAHLARSGSIRPVPCYQSPAFAGRVLGAMLILLCLMPRTARAEDPRDEIRALLDRQVADWNRKDLDGFCRGYWNSPDLVFLSGGEKTRGWTQMRDRYRARYQSEGREMGTLAFREVEVEALGPESAFARGRWDLQFSGDRKAGGRFTLILRKTPEGWRIVHDHTSSDAK